MLVRFGYVAMSVLLENCSPSKSVTFKNYSEIKGRDPGAALNKIKRVASENLTNTIRLLNHNHVHDIMLYRFSSKIIPLATHPELLDWDYITDLKELFSRLGSLVRENSMRVSFHPDHYTLINSPRDEVFEASVRDYLHHTNILEAMGLDSRARLVTHVGGAYKDKEAALQRFIANWARVPVQVAERLTLENDDKTYTTSEVLALCEKLKIPMVLDLHHQFCNPGEGSLREMLPGIFATWRGTGLAPKVHVSSPKSQGEARSHHDFVESDTVYKFLLLAKEVAGSDLCGRDMAGGLDIMVEAKKKDQAMLRLVQELGGRPGVRLLSQARLEI